MPKPADDSQAILDTFETCRKAALAKDGAAALPVLMSNTFKIYDQIRKQALASTERTLATVPPSVRLLAYTMRGDAFAVPRLAEPEEITKLLLFITSCAARKVIVARHAAYLCSLTSPLRIWMRSS